MPYFDGKECTTCPTGTHFDKIDKICVRCPEGFEYNQTTEKCECAKNRFWTGTNCITCYLPKYFDMNKK